MEVQFAVAKVNKYASGESGDTLEMVERPHGGISLVLVDGQRSGKAAKAISNIVARKAIQLLSEGVRDGAAARAAHDYLYTYRGGRVTATLNILSVDTATRTLVISRNNPAPVLVYTSDGGLCRLDEPSEVVGVRRNTKPVIHEIPITIGTLVVAFTDGLSHAGSRGGSPGLDPSNLLVGMVREGVTSAQAIVDALLDRALALDSGRPQDDISIVALAVLPAPGDSARRMVGRIPL
jgi:serine phosphatase RsbU (regulator of sigma subunit)